MFGSADADRNTIRIVADNGRRRCSLLSPSCDSFPVENMKTKVYYADTDAGGVVYYANYLRWLEMARCEWLETLGMSVADYAKQGFVFAVARVEIDYRVPAVLGDAVEIQTAVERVRRVRFSMDQRVVRSADGEELARAKVTVACVNPQGKLIALPESLAEALRERLA